MGSRVILYKAILVNNYILEGSRCRTTRTPCNCVRLRGAAISAPVGLRRTFTGLFSLKTTTDSPCMELVASKKTTELPAIAATAGERACGRLAETLEMRARSPVKFMNVCDVKVTGEVVFWPAT